jgi:predicted DNA-binding helix-hairpin-helix protein
MEELVAVARKLRVDEKFGGYIHLKTNAGCSPELIADAGKYADRLSANVELPTQRDLDRLAPDKSLAVIEGSMATIRDEGLRVAPGSFAPAGQSTQMVVGATDTSDAEIMRTASRLYTAHGLRRVYFTAYSPIPHADARLPPSAPPLVREHRLYQADWLVRRYGFDVEELIDPSAPNLDADIDPKLAWALRHRALFPVDINLAAREMLLRVPGIGEKCVDRVLSARRQHRLRLADLKKLGAVVSRARSFVVALDHHPDVHALDRLDLRDRVKQVQLDLFS